MNKKAKVAHSAAWSMLLAHSLQLSIIGQAGGLRGDELDAVKYVPAFFERHCRA